MSNYLPYIIGQHPEIDHIINKVIMQMGLELGEVSITQLECSKYSGYNNIGIFLLNVEKANNQYTGQWILKVQSSFEDEATNQNDADSLNQISILFWEEQGTIVCHYQQNQDNCVLDIEDIEAINAFQDRLSFLKKSEVIQDLVIIPIAIGQEANDKGLLGYNLQKKANGRLLSDIRQSHSSKLTLPSFWEFDSYESYAAEIEARFEESGAAMTTTEIKDTYYRVGQSLAKLHLNGMLQEPNGALSFSTSFLHGDFHESNIFISAYTVQFIDNDDIIIEHDEIMDCPIDSDLIGIMQNLLFDKFSDTPNDICKYLHSFVKGYISIYNDKVIIAEYLKSLITRYDFCSKYATFIEFDVSDIKDLFDQLSHIIDSIIAEETGNNNCEAGNLPGDVANETIVNE